jgi:hypothetical protein
MVKERNDMTIDGKAELVVQDAKSYQRLLDIADRLETIQAVKEGMASVERGEGRPMDDVFNALEAELRAKAEDRSPSLRRLAAGEAAEEVFPA